MALALRAGIFVVLGLAGAVADDPYDGIARGLLDALACTIGFTALGTYLGLRATG